VSNSTTCKVFSLHTVHHKALLLLCCMRTQMHPLLSVSHIDNHHNFANLITSSNCCCCYLSVNNLALLSPQWLPHPQGACNWSSDHPCVHQVLSIQVVCLNVVSAPVIAATLDQTTSTTADLGCHKGSQA